MATRITLPHDHNDTTEVFARTSPNGCFESAKEPSNGQSLFLFVVFSLLAVVFFFFVVHSATVVPHNIPVIEQYQVPQVTPCGTGYAAQWEDEFTITCMKETR